MGCSFMNLCTSSSIGNLASRAFSELYVRGFLNGGSYEAIPLEVNAYALEERFRRDSHHGFSVQQEVAT